MTRDAGPLPHGPRQRTISRGDGRSRLVRITAESAQLADQLIETHVRSEHALISCLSEDERGSLRRIWNGCSRMPSHGMAVSRLPSNASPHHPGSVPKFRRS